MPKFPYLIFKLSQTQYYYSMNGR